MNSKVIGGKRTLRKTARKSRGRKTNTKSIRNRRRTTKTVTEKVLNSFMRGGSGAATHGVSVHGNHDQQFAIGGSAQVAPVPNAAQAGGNTPAVAPNAAQAGGKRKKGKRSSSKRKRS